MTNEQICDFSVPGGTGRSGGTWLNTGPAVLIILAFVLLIHGLLLLNDGIYWDDWVWLDMPGQTLNWGHISAASKEMGTLPIHTWHARLYDVFHFHWVVFVSVAVAALCVYRLCMQSGWVIRPAGVLIALLSISYPAFQTWHLFCTASYVHNYALFLVAAVLAVQAARWKGGRRWAVRVAALGLFTLSFGMNSLLAYYFGFLFLLLAMAQAGKEMTFRQVFGRLFPSHLDYILVPFVYWLVKRAFFAPSGLYAGYNTPRLAPRVVMQAMAGFTTNAVCGPLNLALRHVLANPLFWGAILLIILWGYRAFDLERLSLTERRGGLYGLLAFGGGLLLLAVVPYAAVGKFPLLYGCNTRHAALVGLPMALLLVAGVGLAFTRRTGQMSCAGWAVLLMLLFGFGRLTVANHLDWQARWIKDRSVMVNLAKLKGAEDFSVYWVKDDFEDNVRSLTFYEWSSMLKCVWGGESRIGLHPWRDPRSGLNPLDSPEFPVDPRRFFTQRYNLAEFDPGGPQAVLTIESGPRIQTDARLIRRYLYYRYVQPADMNWFLSGVTSVHVRPVLP